MEDRDSGSSAPTMDAGGAEARQQAPLGYDTNVVSDYPPVAATAVGNERAAVESGEHSYDVETEIDGTAAHALAAASEEETVEGIPIDGPTERGGRAPQHVLVNERPDGTTTVLTVDPSSGLATYVVLPPGMNFDALPTIPAGDGGSDPRVLSLAIEDLIADQELSLVWRMARTIRLYAVADLLIVAVGVIVWPYFATLLVFPILGFLAAARYLFPLAVVYCVYFPLVIGVRCYLTYVLAVKARDTTMRAVNITVGVVGVLLELYCARLAILFARLLYAVGPARRDELRSGRAVVDRRFYWW